MATDWHFRLRVGKFPLRTGQPQEWTNDTILDRIKPHNVQSDPFHYLTTTEALEPDYYEALGAKTATAR